MKKSEHEHMFFSGPAEVWGSSDQLKRLAEQAKAWSGSDQLRQLAEQSKILGASDQLRQLTEQAKAWSGDDQLRQLAEQAKALSGSDQLRQLAEQAKTLGVSNQSRRIAEQAKAWSGSDQLKQLAKYADILGASDQLRQIADQARVWSGSDQLRRLAEQTKVWSDNYQLRQLGEQALTLGLTFDGVVGELVTRAEKSKDLASSHAGEDQAFIGFENLEFTENSYVDGEVFAPIKRQPLSSVPTWLLYLWLLAVLPMLTALASWEDLRASMVDINARIPQTTTFVGIRNFIRSELSGKPGDVRLVMRSNVRLRSAPGLKSEVLMELPKFAPVIVLEKNDRTWLFVSYEHDGFFIEGYVSSKLLRKVRK
ncbi:SH3 domain-containing protein [Pseudomonas brassicacearum]|uniref:SH3 domain-containing protein n=1 Tax=Pseudomonas brassicacearum TaxID=930166 RepID=UPI003441E433